MIHNTQTALDIAKLILKGFHNHYERFRHTTAGAALRFCNQQWQAVQQAAHARIDFYDARIKETTEQLKQALPNTKLDETFWSEVKTAYTGLLVFHPQAELAETFYNSVFCHRYHRRYFHNRFIYVETTLGNETPVPVASEYGSYFPVTQGMRATLLQVLQDIALLCEFEDLDRDITRLVESFREQTSEFALAPHQLRLDVLRSPFFRNKAAYVVGRIVTRRTSYPFIVPVLGNSKGLFYVDTLITASRELSIIFSFARAYFMVNTQVPSALVRFLYDLMPHKTKAELYASIGFHKQGKTEFYRELLQHFKCSDDKLVVAPGVAGLVMMVFTLPSFPYVFKVIRDKFGSSKEFGRQTVVARYQLVKSHDRAGRMADTLEYSNVALPLNRFSPDLLESLQATVSSSLEIEGDYVVFRHLYIERRLTPLNIYLQYASPDETSAVIEDYGQAIKDMLAANIFPGDMLLKNFGVTRLGRVVFYDYDEVQYLTDMNFRSLPIMRDEQDQLAGEAWYSVAENDVFPEQLTTYVFPQQKFREIFLLKHPELVSADYWRRQRNRILAGEVADVMPYPNNIRFRHKYGL